MGLLIDVTSYDDVHGMVSDWTSTTTTNVGRRTTLKHCPRRCWPDQFMSLLYGFVKTKSTGMMSSSLDVYVSALLLSAQPFTPAHEHE